ncbi:Nucleotidyltransferase, partial [Meredithblackwellia eburnea MCA 4105]
WNAISELLTNGEVKMLSELDKEDQAALKFLRVHGIAKRYAEKYIDEGAKTFKQLGKLKLTKAQRIGLRHIDDIDRLIPRSEMEVLRKTLFDLVQKLDERFESAILGSYRRGVEFSSDIDLVLRHELYKEEDDEETPVVLLTKVVEKLLGDGLIKEEDKLMFGKKKYSGLIKLPDEAHFRRIDIRIVPYHCYPYNLLGFTGDALLMKLLRHTAKQKGWTLNEYGMGEK